jgi:hypothetical protein
MVLPRPAGTVGAALTGAASTNGNCEQYESALPLRLLSAERCRATEQGYPLYLAPPQASILAVGAASNSLSPLSAVAWASQSGIVVAIEGRVAEAGRTVRVHVWTVERGLTQRTVKFHRQADRAIAIAEFCVASGSPISGLAFLSLHAPGEE